MRVVSISRQVQFGRRPVLWNLRACPESFHLARAPRCCRSGVPLETKHSLGRWLSVLAPALRWPQRHFKTFVAAVLQDMGFFSGCELAPGGGYLSSNHHIQRPSTSSRFNLFARLPLRAARVGWLSAIGLMVRVMRLFQSVPSKCCAAAPPGARVLACQTVAVNGTVRSCVSSCQ